MSQLVACSEGHQWEIAANASTDASTCPVCGRKVVSLTAAKKQDGLADELPPPPNPVPVVVATDDKTQNIETDPRPREAPAIPGYEILGQLGEGGMGVVYKALQTTLNRRVALKLIAAGPAPLAGELARFHTEAEAIAQLQHPNIVQVFEAGVYQGRPYLVLELVDGGCLADKLRGAPAPPQAAAELVEKLARAIDFAHRRGIVHRDLKPANVLLSVVSSPSSVATTTEEQPRTKYQEQRTTPKITDFGLAKRMDRDSGQTRTGAILGTPSYMAPEQAMGHGRQVGPTADVYALGAILYEMLTGRPPFHGSTPLETLEHVRTQDPVPPKRLVPKLGRDLDTICLKCLSKAPKGRYQTALELADDLKRFRAGEPIHARPVSQLEKTWRWCRRHPQTAALAIAMSLLVLGGVAVLLWVVTNRALRQAELADAERNLRRDLTQAHRLRSELHEQLREASGIRRLLDRPALWEGHIKEAIAILKRAESLPNAVKAQIDRKLAETSESLITQLNHDETDRRFVLRLEKIRLDIATKTEGGFDYARTMKQYRDAFHNAGFALQKKDAKTIAATIKRSAIRQQLVAALDNWALVAAIDDKSQESHRLLRVARLADPDPWRDQVRDPSMWKDKSKWQKLVNEIWAAEQSSQWRSPQLLEMIANVEQKHGRDAEKFLRAAQARYPADFWINLSLGDVLNKKKSTEAIGFYRAALAIRQENNTVYNNLGIALRRIKDFEGAKSAYRKAMKLAPKDVKAIANLSRVLTDENNLNGASELLRTAIKLDANFAGAHNNIGVVLRKQGKLDKAIAAFNRAITLDPKFGMTYQNLGRAIGDKKDWMGAEKALKKALSLGRINTEVYYNLGIVLAKQQRHSEAAAAYKKSIQLDPRNVEARQNLGLTLIVRMDWEGAAAVFRESIKVNPTFPKSRLGLGLTLLLRARPAEAFQATQQGLNLLSPSDPLHQFARNQLARCEKLVPADNHATLVLAGKKKAKSAFEKLAMAQYCFQSTKRYRDAARFYRSAFADRPDLTADVINGHLRNAAAAAVQAATAKNGSEALSADEQIKLRRQALRWLRAELEFWRKNSIAGTSRIKALLYKTLSQWQKDPNLIGVRDTKMLAKLPKLERKDWLNFWANVQATLPKAPVALRAK